MGSTAEDIHGKDSPRENEDRGTHVVRRPDPLPGRRTGSDLDPPSGQAIDSMFLVTTSIVSLSSAVGLNSTISVSGKISGVWPGPT